VGVADVRFIIECETRLSEEKLAYVRESGAETVCLAGGLALEYSFMICRRLDEKRGRDEVADTTEESPPLIR
jgi:hypothetical protein